MPNLTPAALGQGFSQGIADFNNEQTAALNAQRAQVAKQQYEESMKPIDIKEAFTGVPDFLQPTFMKLAKSQGIIEQNGQNVFIRKGKMQELQEGFAKNKILQAGVLQEALQGLDAQNAELEKAGSQLKPVIDKFEESWKQRALKLKDKDGKVDAMKLEALKKERDEYMANSPEYQQYNQLSQTAQKNAVNKMKTLQFLGIIDDGFKKDAEKWGTEEAMKAATDINYRQALIQRDEESKARAWFAPREALERVRGEVRKDVKSTPSASSGGHGGSGADSFFKSDSTAVVNGVETDVFQNKKKAGYYYKGTDGNTYPLPGNIVTKKKPRSGIEDKPFVLPGGGSPAGTGKKKESWERYK